MPAWVWNNEIDNINDLPTEAGIPRTIAALQRIHNPNTPWLPGPPTVDRGDHDGDVYFGYDCDYVRVQGSVGKTLVVLKRTHGDFQNPQVIKYEDFLNYPHERISAPFGWHDFANPPQLLPFEAPVQAFEWIHVGGPSEEQWRYGIFEEEVILRWPRTENHDLTWLGATWQWVEHPGHVQGELVNDIDTRPQSVWVTTPSNTKFLAFDGAEMCWDLQSVSSGVNAQHAVTPEGGYPSAHTIISTNQIVLGGRYGDPDGDGTELPTWNDDYTHEWREGEAAGPAGVLGYSYGVYHPVIPSPLVSGGLDDNQQVGYQDSPLFYTSNGTLNATWIIMLCLPKFTPSAVSAGDQLGPDPWTKNMVQMPEIPVAPAGPWYLIGKARGGPDAVSLYYCQDASVAPLPTEWGWENQTLVDASDFYPTGELGRGQQRREHRYAYLQVPEEERATLPFQTIHLANSLDEGQFHGTDYFNSLSDVYTHGTSGWWLRWRTTSISNLAGGYAPGVGGYGLPECLTTAVNVYTAIAGFSSIHSEPLLDDDRRIDELDNVRPWSFEPMTVDRKIKDLMWTVRGVHDNSAIESMIDAAGYMNLTENTRGDWQTPLNGVLVGMLLDFSSTSVPRCGWGWGPGWMLIKGSAK